jgi:hypothetical protein
MFSDAPALISPDQPWLPPVWPAYAYGLRRNETRMLDAVWLG